MKSTRTAEADPKRAGGETATPAMAEDSEWRTTLGHIALLDGRADGPAVVQPGSPPDNVAEWAEEAREDINSLVDRHKAALLRGFGIDTVEKFQAFLKALRADLLEYTERSTPRSKVEARIYTSTEYPRSHEIPMHNENSYSAKWPRRIVFCCLQPAEEGGVTPIADSRAVFAEIGEDVRRGFVEKKVMYSRNFGQGVDLSWQEAFQTENRQEVEAYCRSFDISFEWFDDGNGLHTHQVRPAAITYLPSGERLWFNQAHLFHISSLEPSLRHSLSALFPAERLPRHAFYGDGSQIEEEALHEIREVYKRLRIPVRWKKGDLLLLDNLFYAHGRLPFAGERRVVVAMDGDGRTHTSPL